MIVVVAEGNQGRNLVPSRLPSHASAMATLESDRNRVNPREVNLSATEIYLDEVPADSTGRIVRKELRVLR
jgi:hypothetical protein